jgi:hypothetical protein
MMFNIGDRVGLKLCPEIQYTIDSVRQLKEPTNYEPPVAFTMVCGAFWPGQCLVLIIGPESKAEEQSPIDQHMATVEANIKKKYGRKKAAALIAALGEW